jgi:uroporphyrinogen decarboxylase
VSTPKENVIQSFRGEKPARVPVGICLGGSWPFIQAGVTLQSLIGDPVQAAKIFYEIHEGLDADLLITGAGSTALLIRALGGQVAFTAKGAPEILAPLITAESDLDRLDMETVFDDPGVKWLRDTAAELLCLAGEQRLVLASGRAPFTLATQLFGLENFARALYKNQDFILRLLEFTTLLSSSFFRFMSDFVDGAFIADPTASGDVISKRHFANYALPYLKRVAGSVKNSNGLVMVHICGDISDRLDLFANTAIDNLSLDKKVDLVSARKTLDRRVSMSGNVDPVEILEFGTEEEVRRATLECLQDGAMKGGFVLLPGCDPSARVPANNIRSFVETGHEWHN